MEVTWTDVLLRQEVTEEVLDVARNIVDGWYQDGPIDWGDVWDRVDGSSLEDGSRIHLGDSTATPAFRMIKQTILKERREG